MKTYTYFIQQTQCNVTISAHNKREALAYLYHTLNLAYDSIVICLGVNL